MRRLIQVNWMNFRLCIFDRVILSVEQGLVQLLRNDQSKPLSLSRDSSLRIGLLALCTTIARPVCVYEEADLFAWLLDIV
jgi:hypothetical protein